MLSLKATDHPRHLWSSEYRRQPSRTRQHEAVDAGRPYAQLQEAGMQTAQLTEIIRQQDAALKATVERLSMGDVEGAIRTKCSSHPIMSGLNLVPAYSSRKLRSCTGIDQKRWRFIRDCRCIFARKPF